MSTDTGDARAGDGAERSAAAIWRQTAIPVIYRPGKGHPLLVKFPWGEDNGVWLRGERQRRPQWNDQWRCWEVPLAWINDTVRRFIFRFGHTYLIQPYREKEICAPACWYAHGFECECSCMGKNHGDGRPDGKWYVKAETLAIRWKERKLSCQLITRAEKPLTRTQTGGRVGGVRYDL